MSRKLTATEVNRIRDQHVKRSKYPHPGSTRALASKFGVSVDYVRDLVNHQARTSRSPW